MLIAQSILAIVQGVLAISLIGLILLQQGSGADAGVAFGSGSSTMFGARGAGNLLTRLTAALAALFVINCLALAFVYKQQLRQGSVLAATAVEAAETAETDSETSPTTGTDEIEGAAATIADDSVPAIPASSDATEDADTSDGAAVDDAPAPITLNPADLEIAPVDTDAETP